MPMRRNKLLILKNLDVDAALPYFRRQDFPPVRRNGTGAPVTEREVVLAGLHKARLRLPEAFTSAELRESREWLTAHGYSIPEPALEKDRS